MQQLYVGALDGRLIALDAATGKEAWSVQTTDTSKPYTITGAPRVIKDKVLIGNGGGEYGVRGYITAYDAETGDQAWRWYSVPGDPANGDEQPELTEARKTWNGEFWKLGGGGTLWDGMAYDPELDIPVALKVLKPQYAGDEAFGHGGQLLAIAQAHRHRSRDRPLPRTRRSIDRHDQARRQVFIEAVIMDQPAVALAILRGLADDKHLSKLCAAARGIPTAPWKIYRRGAPVEPSAPWPWPILLWLAAGQRVSFQPWNPT